MSLAIEVLKGVASELEHDALELVVDLVSEIRRSSNQAGAAQAARAAVAATSHAATQQAAAAALHALKT